jgi:hypothetical protein
VQIDPGVQVQDTKPISRTFVSFATRGIPGMEKPSRFLAR